MCFSSTYWKFKYIVCLLYNFFFLNKGNTFFPLISHVMCGAGRAFDVVQLARKFSPTKNCRLLKLIRGGPVWATANQQISHHFTNNNFLFHFAFANKHFSFHSLSCFLFSYCPFLCIFQYVCCCVLMWFVFHLSRLLSPHVSLMTHKHRKLLPV